MHLTGHQRIGGCLGMGSKENVRQGSRDRECRQFFSNSVFEERRGPGLEGDVE